MIIKGASFHKRDVEKDDFSKSLAIFQKMHLFKILVKSHILQISEDLLFF